MKISKNVIKNMRDDAQILALVASVDAPFTISVIDAVGNWFDDVEIKYPIPDMELTEQEQRTIVRLASDELLTHFQRVYEISEKEDGLSKEHFEDLALLVDPLWREISGAFSKVLNERFNNTRIPEDMAGRYLEEMIERFKNEQGEYAASEFINAIKSDKKLRAHLRRMGVDPDLA
jgi:hypothetical protein